MNKACEICGGTGNDDLINICSQCKETHEHVYCMTISYDGDPEKWVCHECQSPSQTPLPSPVLSKPIEGLKIRFTIRRPLSNSKVQYLSPEEVMGLESGAPKTKFSPSKIPRRDCGGFKRLPPKFSLKPNPRVEPRAIRNPLKSGSVPRSSSDEKWLAAVKQKSVINTQLAWKDSAVNTGWSSRSPPSYNGTEEKVTGEGPGRYVCQGTTAKPCPPRPYGELVNTATKRENNDSRQSVQCSHASSSGEGPVKHVCQGTTAEPLPSEEIHKTSTEKENKEHLVQRLCVASSGNDVCASTKQRGTDAESMESSEVAMTFEKSLPNHPAESPTWRGKFNVTSNVSSCVFYDGIVAHPPSKVHRKVYELSKQLPKSLHFELRPRLSLWKELFDEDIPGATDIGLYFLPSKSCEEIYFRLVERLTECDMILKSCVNGVELLIFSSKNLQDGCEHIDQRCFLWGVFHSCEDTMMGDKETPTDIMAPIDDQTFRMEEDMEVDMIGGQEMDNVDKVVAKPAQPLLDGATPEFSPLKVKKETPSLGLSSLIEHEMSFERELQRCFDRFGAAFMKGKGIQAVKLENTD